MRGTECRKTNRAEGNGACNMMTKPDLFSSKYHFIGIGGCGMSGLAAYLHLNGAVVTGSDSRKSIYTEELEHIGIPIFYSHSEHNIPDCDMVVYTPAVKLDNSELQYARDAGIPTIKRGQMLAQIAASRKTIAIAGSHGKTSTAALLTWIMRTAGIDTNALIGGMMRNYERNYICGNSDWCVVEADESDGSMQLLEPDILILLNIDDDHIDHYGSTESMVAAYASLANKTRSRVFINDDDPLLQQLSTGCDANKVTFFGGKGQYCIDTENLCYTEANVLFRISNGIEAHDVDFLQPQSFNVSNFLAAVETARHIGIDFQYIQDAAATFKGVKRRGEVWHSASGVSIIEDYAHHPTEIAHMLGTLKSVYKKRRLVCLFQPHRYTRSKHIASTLANAFRHADVLVLTDIYSADELPIPGIDGNFVYNVIAAKRTKECHYVADYKNLPDFIRSHIQYGDIVVFMGAGSIGALAQECHNQLETELYT